MNKISKKVFDSYLNDNKFKNSKQSSQIENAIMEEFIQKPELYQKWISNLLIPSKKDEALAFLWYTLLLFFV